MTPYTGHVQLSVRPSAQCPAFNCQLPADLPTAFRYIASSATATNGQRSFGPDIMTNWSGRGNDASSTSNGRRQTADEARAMPRTCSPRHRWPHTATPTIYTRDDTGGRYLARKDHPGVGLLTTSSQSSKHDVVAVRPAVQRHTCTGHGDFVNQRGAAAAATSSKQASSWRRSTMLTYALVRPPYVT